MRERNQMNRREFLKTGAAGLVACAAATRAADAKQIADRRPLVEPASWLPDDPSPEEMEDLRRKWSYWMDPPKGYRFEPEVKFVRKFELDDCDAELYLQRNGPKPWHMQRVLKMFPKNMSRTPVPVVVCPDYYIESIADFELYDVTKHLKWSHQAMMRHLARKGVASITCDAYHMNYVQNDLERNDMHRWTVASNALYRDWPTWNCMGKKVFDTRLTIDMLEADGRFDMKRVGIAGHSLGGQTSLYAGCLDSRVKAIMCSDFGFRFDQTCWDVLHYWGGRLETARKADGLENYQLLTLSGAKPFCLIAGMYDDDTSAIDMMKAKGYKSRPGDLMFINHASGHGPTPWALEAGYDFLMRKLNGIWGNKPWA